MTTDSFVLYEKHGPVACITLNRPEKRNAINAAMAQTMRQLLDDLEQDEQVRAVIITGGADVFCAGMDLQAFRQGEGAAIFDGPGGFAGFVAASVSRPLIAAVEGFALAGGFELALACDMIVASRSAMFGLPEVTVGLFAAAGGAFRLPQRLPANKAVELMLTGNRLAAPQAEALGLVNALTDDGEALAVALHLAQKIAANAPLGVQASLKLAREARCGKESEFWRLSDELWAQVRASDDAKEGPAAFLEKRPPKWTGK